MTAETSQAEPSAADVSQPRVNRLAIVSIVLAGVAVVGPAVRSLAPLLSGAAVLAIFAVGTGHVALQQIKVRRDRGAVLAYIALGVCYLLATYALGASLVFGVMNWGSFTG